MTISTRELEEIHEAGDLFLAVLLALGLDLAALTSSERARAEAVVIERLAVFRLKAQLRILERILEGMDHLNRAKGKATP